MTFKNQISKFWLDLEEFERVVVLLPCSGSAMNVAYGPAELKKFLSEAARVSQVSLNKCGSKN